MSNDAIEIAKLPLVQLGLACNLLTARKQLPHDLTAANKSTKCAAVAEAIRLGHITLAEVRSLTPVAVSQMAHQAVHQATDPKVEAAANAAARAEQLALDAKTSADSLCTKVQTLGGELWSVAEVVTATSKTLGAVQNEIKRLAEVKVPDIDVAAAIDRQVQVALAPVIKAAKKNKSESRVVAAAAAPTARKLVDEVFGVEVRDAKGRMLSVDIWDNPDAPAVDPFFIWTPEILKVLLLGQDTGARLWFGGEKGTGKTQTAQQFAARTGRAFTRVNFHKFTVVEDFIGGTQLIGGQTQFSPGDFLRSFCLTPGSVTLLDEVTNADPGELAILNGLLEPGGRVNIGGSVWSGAAGSLVFAADNTLGHGDLTGRYAGLRVMNSALLNRFGYKVAFTFLPLQQEIDAVVNHTQCDPALAGAVMRVINTARAKVATGDLVDAPSIRDVIAWVRGMGHLGVRGAWDATVAASQPAESAVAIEAVYTAEVNESEIGALI